MNDKYTDGVLDERFESIKEKMDDQFEAITGVLHDIKEQTTKTNGSVASVKTELAVQKGFNNAIKLFGGILIPVLIGTIGYLVISYVNLEGNVKSNTANITNLQKNLPDMLTAAAKAGVEQAATGR